MEVVTEVTNVDGFLVMRVYRGREKLGERVLKDSDLLDISRMKQIEREIIG